MDVMAVLTDPIAQELLTAAIPMRLAYTALDGTPRVIPIGFHWDGAHLLVFTIPTSAKVRALAANPHVAMTIDTNIAPHQVLLIRGTAQLSTVDGVPEEYLAASHRLVPAAGWDDFDAGVRALYSHMTRIAITPTWAKIFDFETRVPSAVEEMIKQAGT